MLPEGLGALPYSGAKLTAGLKGGGWCPLPRSPGNRATMAVASCVTNAYRERAFTLSLQGASGSSIILFGPRDLL